ncbi:MAG: ABC transporter ATP-binding protein/permease [Candidatus Melainabacteria bacterium]|nr:MAG: ABC transporter ATP-binding protein/permease [Candidatus Melainabacteria bacterium]
MNGIDLTKVVRLVLALAIMTGAYFFSSQIVAQVAAIYALGYVKLGAGAAVVALVLWTLNRFKIMAQPLAWLKIGLGFVVPPVFVGLICAGMNKMYEGLFVTTIFPGVDNVIRNLPTLLATEPTGYVAWAVLAAKTVATLWLASKAYKLIAPRFGVVPSSESSDDIVAKIKAVVSGLANKRRLGAIGVSLVVGLVAMFGIVAALPIVATFLGTILPILHIAVEIGMFAFPVYLYVTKIAFRPANAKNYLGWFIKLAKPHWTGEKWFITWGYLIVIVAFIYLIGQLNSTLQDAMIGIKNALVAKDQAAYNAAFWTSLSVFAFAVLFMPFNIWIRAKAYMHWRKDMTKWVLNKYLAVDRKYYTINGYADIDNPDERIHEDVNEFTTRTYSLVLTFADVVTTLSIFTVKLWAISSILGFAAVAYALAGTIIMLFFANKMVGYMVNEKRTEANFRYYLIFIRIMAESIAFFRGESRERDEVERRFAKIVENYNRLIGWTRNQSFVTQAYGYMDYFVVLLIVVPLYFAGQVEYGVIDGAQMAFSMVLGSLSVFVSNFVTFSKLAAISERLGHFVDRIEQKDSNADLPNFNVIVEPSRKDIVLEGVTIHTPNHPRLLVKDMSLVIGPDKSTIFVGPSGSGKTSAFRVISGLWPKGTGTIKRPHLDDFMFLPQKPYMSVGTLRDQVLYPNIGKMEGRDELAQSLILERRATVSDEEIKAILADLGLPNFAERYPQGLDTVQEHVSWGDVLSPGEQLRVSFARVLINKPKIVFLDEATAALDGKNEKVLYTKLKALGVTFASVGHRPSLVHFHDQVLELMGDETGGYLVMTPAEYVEKQRKEAEEKEKQS